VWLAVRQRLAPHSRAVWEEGAWLVPPPPTSQEQLNWEKACDNRFERLTTDLIIILTFSTAHNPFINESLISCRKNEHSNLKELFIKLWGIAQTRTIAGPNEAHKHRLWVMITVFLIGLHASNGRTLLFLHHKIYVIIWTHTLFGISKYFFLKRADKYNVSWKKKP